MLRGFVAGAVLTGLASNVVAQEVIADGEINVATEAVAHGNEGTDIKPSSGSLNIDLNLDVLDQLKEIPVTRSKKDLSFLGFWLFWFWAIPFNIVYALTKCLPRHGRVMNFLDSYKGKIGSVRKQKKEPVGCDIKISRCVYFCFCYPSALVEMVWLSGGKKRGGGCCGKRKCCTPRDFSCYASSCLSLFFIPCFALYFRLCVVGVKFREGCCGLRFLMDVCWMSTVALVCPCFSMQWSHEVLLARHTQKLVELDSRGELAGSPVEVDGEVAGDEAEASSVEIMEFGV